MLNFTIFSPFRLVTLGAIFLLFCQPTLGSDPLSDQEFLQLQRLQRLVQNQQFQSAWELAQSLANQLDGISRFDFLYARAALENKKYDLASFALERVLVDNPNDYRAHLDMGRALFFSQHFNQAQQHFDLVLAQIPPASIVTICQEYKNAIELKRKKTQRHHQTQIALHLGYDSNINQGPSHAELSAKNNRLALTQLDDNSTAIDDQYLQFTGQYQQTRPVSRQHAINTLYNVSIKHGAKHSLTNQMQWSVSRGSRLAFQKFSWLNQVTFTQSFSDYQASNSSLIFNSQLPFRWTPQLSISPFAMAALQFSWQQLDSTHDSFGANVTLMRHPMQHQFSFTLSRFDYADQTQDHLAHLGQQLKYQLQARLGSKFEQHVSLGLNVKSFDEPDLLFVDSLKQGITRNDQGVTLRSQSIWLTSKHWRLSTTAQFTSQKSNIEIYNMQRLDIHLGLKHHF